MTSSIGRIVNLPDPSPLERGGIEYGLSWLVAPETLAEATARIAQFRGLTEGEFVPVEASCRGRNMDGLYRVSSCDISEIAGAEDPNAPTPIRVDVSMVRVATGVVPAEVGERTRQPLPGRWRLRRHPAMGGQRRRDGRRDADHGYRGDGAPRVVASARTHRARLSHPRR